MRSARQASRDNLVPTLEAPVFPGTSNEFITALEEIGQTHREKKVPLSMVYMDVDGFSQINRKYDREAGDEVIKVIQRLFDGVFREHYFRKWGKDEFISFLSGVPEESLEEYVAYTGRKRFAYLVEPEKVSSWDHTKLL